MNPYILNIETSTEVCSVSLQKGGNLIAYIKEETPFSHSKRLTVIIEQIVAHADIKLKDLDAIAVSEGPGSYTGLRVASAVAKGLCYGLDCKLIAINTLDIIAMHLTDASQYDYIIPTIDARRDEAYISIISKSGVYIKKDLPFIFTNESFEFLRPFKKIIICGNAANKASDLIKTEGLEYIDYSPDAKDMISRSIGLYQKSVFKDIGQFSPNYIKNPNITTSKKKLL